MYQTALEGIIDQEINVVFDYMDNAEAPWD